MRFACWITKATDTHSESISLSAFPWQQLLLERALVSHFYVHSLVCFKNLKANSGIATGVKLERLASTSLHIHCLYIKYTFNFLSLHHHHVPEGLGVFPVPWSSRWSWSLHLVLGRPMFLRPFGLYCSACFGSLFVSILCTCCSHFFWYCFISFCAPVFCLIHWFFSLSSFVIPSKCLKNLICAASKRCSSLFFSTQASLPNFNAALAVMLWILNFVSLFIFFSKMSLYSSVYFVICFQFIF